MKWLRPGTPPYQTALAMVGARPGNRVLVVGATDPGLTAELARVTGLNGRLVVVDPSPDRRASMEAAARDAGALLECVEAPIDAPPADPDGYDVAVVLAGLAMLDPNTRARCVAAALQALRPGGRVITREGRPPAGLFGSFRRSPAALASEPTLDLLKQAGASAVRVLAAVEDVTYCEGRKPHA